MQMGFCPLREGASGARRSGCGGSAARWRGTEKGQGSRTAPGGGVLHSGG